MILQRSHPLLRGCRLLWLHDSTASARNRHGGGPAGTVSGSPSEARSGPWRAISFAAGGSDKVTFGAGTGYGIGQRGLTVIARVRLAGDSGETGGLTGLVSNKDAASTDSTSGFALYWIRDTYTNPGYNFTLYQTGGFYWANSSSFAGSGEYGNDRVVAGVFDPKTNGPRVFVDGLEYTNLGSQGLGGSPESLTWNPSSSAALEFAYIQNEASHLNGALAWVALFDRALSPREVQLWSRDSEWPFLRDEEPLHFLTSTTYRNYVNVSKAYAVVGGAGGVTYTSQVDALSYLGGDIAVDPDPGTALYRNRVNVRNALAQAQATALVRYKNAVQAAQALTTYRAVRYTNVVRVGQRRRTLIDGRADLLSTGRYRR